MLSKLTVSPTWYQTFFDGMAVDFWDGATADDWTADEVDLLASVFTSPAALLDVLCGAGRHIPALCQKGFAVTGIDISEGMLALAKERCEGMAAGFYQADAMAGLEASLPGEGLYDGAYCLGNSFGYGDAEISRRFLASIVSALRPGGKLVLNSAMVAETLLPNWETKMEMVAGGIFASIENVAYDPVLSRLTTRFHFEKEAEEGAPSQKERHTICHYVFTTGEIIRWLGEMGVECLAVYGNAGKKPYALGDEQWYGIFRKKTAGG